MMTKTMARNTSTEMIAELLNKLAQKNKPNRAPGTATTMRQAESKNGAIVRKHLGYSHIPQRSSTASQCVLLVNHLNPYINFHSTLPVR